MADLEAQTPSIVVRVVDASGNDRTDVRTLIDGRAVKLDGKPISLDPGEHVVSVETPEGLRREQKVLVAVREKSRLLTVQTVAKAESSNSPAPEPSDKPARPAAGAEQGPPTPSATRGIPVGALVVGGVGVASLGSALYFGLKARTQYDELKRECAPRCNPESTDAAHQKAVIADVSLAVGVAALAGGVLWAVLAPKNDSGARTSSIRFDVRPTRQEGFVTTIGGSF